jgi:hypothetical protein
MWVAFYLAKQTLPKYSSKFSRRDFTLPQLFACLVVREHQKQTYRGVEALLRDAEHWCRDIGMKKVPDHNTLCRAFHALNLGRRASKLLDVLAQWFGIAHQLGSTVAIDSSLYDTHYRSRHYEQRCRHFASQEKNTANWRRSRSAKHTPKVIHAADIQSHVILSARSRIGMGGDYPHFEPALFDAWRRSPRRIRTVLADSGFGSEANHRIARLDMGIRSVMKCNGGRPTDKPPKGRFRRLMSRQLAGSQKSKTYGQRAQIETVESMIKRNLGDALRSRSERGRCHELLLRSITHNIMLFRRQSRGSRQSPTFPQPEAASMIPNIRPIATWHTMFGHVKAATACIGGDVR